MTDDEDPEAVPAAASPADERRRVRQAQIDAENEHGRQLAERYGREMPRQRFAAIGHAVAKRRRRR